MVGHSSSTRSLLLKLAGERRTLSTFTLLLPGNRELFMDDSARTNPELANAEQAHQPTNPLNQPTATYTTQETTMDTLVKERATGSTHRPKTTETVTMDFGTKPKQTGAGLVVRSA